jgi:hypothetical protein
LTPDSACAIELPDSTSLFNNFRRRRKRPPGLVARCRMAAQGAPGSQSETVLDGLGELRRTHRCGEIGPALVGRRVTLAGWVQRSRDHGGLIFVDLRDGEGLVQVVFRPDAAPECHARAGALRSEWVIAASGVVQRRSAVSRVARRVIVSHSAPCSQRDRDAGPAREERVVGVLTGQLPARHRQVDQSVPRRSRDTVDKVGVEPGQPHLCAGEQHTRRAGVEMVVELVVLQIRGAAVDHNCLRPDPGEGIACGRAEPWAGHGYGSAVISSDAVRRRPV